MPIALPMRLCRQRDLRQSTDQRVTLLPRQSAFPAALRIGLDHEQRRQQRVHKLFVTDQRRPIRGAQPDPIQVAACPQRTVNVAEVVNPRLARLAGRQVALDRIVVSCQEVGDQRPVLARIEYLPSPLRPAGSRPGTPTPVPAPDRRRARSAGHPPPPGADSSPGSCASAPCPARRFRRRWAPRPDHWAERRTSRCPPSDRRSAQAGRRRNVSGRPDAPRPCESARSNPADRHRETTRTVGLRPSRAPRVRSNRSVPSSRIASCQPNQAQLSTGANASRSNRSSNASNRSREAGLPTPDAPAPASGRNGSRHRHPPRPRWCTRPHRRRRTGRAEVALRPSRGISPNSHATSCVGRRSSARNAGQTLVSRAAASTRRPKRNSIASPGSGRRPSAAVCTTAMTAGASAAGCCIAARSASSGTPIAVSKANLGSRRRSSHEANPGRVEAASRRPPGQSGERRILVIASSYRPAFGRPAWMKLKSYCRAAHRGY